MELLLLLLLRYHVTPVFQHASCFPSLHRFDALRYLASMFRRWGLAQELHADLPPVSSFILAGGLVHVCVCRNLSEVPSF